MKNVLPFLSCIFMLSLAAPALAQQVTASTGTLTAVQPHFRQNLKRKAAPAGDKTILKESVKSEQPEDEGAVMVDARGDDDLSGRFSEAESAADAEEPEGPAVPGGMPASYGQLKGALNDGGRSLLIFENEGGVISFVQIFAGKSAVTWKLVSRIFRSGD